MTIPQDTEHRPIPATGLQDEARAREVLARAYESHGDRVRAYEVRGGGHQLHVDAMLAFARPTEQQAVERLMLNSVADHRADDPSAGFWRMCSGCSGSDR
jgi:hypothetical protein